MSQETCRCCGSPAIELFGRKTGEFIRREFSFLRCRDCGFIRVEPFSGFEIYNDAYYRGEGPDPYVDYVTEYRDWRATDRAFEFRDMWRIASDFFSAAPANAAPLRWLDFGCGAGGLLKFLRAQGALGGRPLELAGHDVGSYADLLQRADGFRILNWDHLATEPAGCYDVISLIEVLEHLPEPRPPLERVARLLKPGGLLLLTTGNLSSIVARRQGVRYRYCMPEIHVSLFNPECLTRLYRHVGLEPYSVRYDGAVRFKVLKSLRHRPVPRGIARGALALPPVVRAIDALYGVSAMPCAVKAGQNSGR